MVLGGKGHIFKGVTRMKLMATFLVAVFVVAVGTSFAFGDCAGHNKAQLVKNQNQEQISKDQPASTGSQFTVAEKPAEPAKQVKTLEKK
jgi:3-hydroxyisobutyrate dehydrogenase-like beta-hydroxyacid dehydrogenase